MLTGELRRKLALYLRAAAATRSANFPGLPFLPKSRDSASCRGGYNTFLLWMKQLGLADVRRIFDVGANHGDFASAAAAYYPGAQIWLFEPLPVLWPRLERLAQQHNPHWSVERFALGGRRGQLPLWVDEADDAIGSFLGFSGDYQRGHSLTTPGKAIETRVERLDEFCAETKISSIDLVKVDVEGFEFDVMTGAGEMLSRITAVIVEVSLIRRPADTDDPLEHMIGLLRRAGFHLVDLIPSLFSKEEPWKPLEYNLLARR
ncbi:MAG: FkbM family methyltransferase [Chthoniobacterales bacterium]